ncbi:MAG: chemotaxis protein CheW [Janthinobacterium lividum]
MSLDITQFYETFFDEADELLAEMERLLLSLDVQRPDSEQLNAIFRAAHSIKGGAATFGFSVLTDTTHVLESVLDQARNGELTLRTDMIDVFLEAKDVLEKQLRAYRESAGSVEPDRQLGAALADKLKAVSQASAPLAVAASTAAATAVTTAGTNAAHAPAAAPASADAQREQAAKAAQAAQAAQDAQDEQDALNDPDGPPNRVIRQLQEIAGVVHAAAPVAAAAAPAAAPTSGASTGSPLKIKLIDLSESDAVLLVAELGNLGKVVGREQSGNLLTVWLESDCAPDVIIAVCCFVINEEQIEIDTRAGAVPASAVAAAAAPVAPAAAAEAAGATSVVASAPATGGPLATVPAVPAAQATVARNAPGAAAPAASHEAGSIRVGIDKVDSLINLVGELVITQAMLAQTASNFDPVLHDRLFNGLSLLERNARDLQEAVMSIRMMPMDYVFSRFPRLVRDLASKLGKKVDLVTVGQATELDKSLIERIIDPLTHLVRNSLDHGIETPDVRQAAGKEAAGQLVLSAEHMGGNIVIEVSDDGAGLNRERILAKAMKQGMAVSDAMSDEDVAQLIFMPGFSTADQVTDISGRGVGMDVVKRNIQDMGGHVEVQSRAGAGTTTRILLPLTLAILDGMSVKVGAETFIVPLNSVMESLQPTNDELFTIAGGQDDGRVIRVRGEYLPIVALHKVFGVVDARTDPTKAIVIILQAEGRRFALLVDELLGQHQVVVKNLETNYRKVFGISAATILGDGSVALIIDVPALNRSSRDDLCGLKEAPAAAGQLTHSA